jgi:cytochrome b
LDTPPLQATLIWDWPTRLGHWLLAGLIAFSWWSAENHHLDWHQLSGLAVLGLIAFRLIWGIIGGSTARFSHFVRGPRAAIAYLRGNGSAQSIGHNPLGGWSVLALLAAVAATVGFGLFAVDVDGLESGPLSQYVSFDIGRTASGLHHMAFNVLLALIALHLAAIAFYTFVKRHSLVGPMITGRKHLPLESDILRPAALWRLAGAAVIAGGLVFAVMHAPPPG